MEWYCVPRYLGRMWAHYTRPRWCMEEWCIWNMTIGRGRLKYPVVHFPPQISPKLSCGWTRAYAVRNRLLTACIMASNSAYSPALKMDITRSSKTLVNFYQTTWRHISHDSIRHKQRRSSLCNCHHLSFPLISNMLYRTFLMRPQSIFFC
jgi:hypothetical protein